jgi:hypothetical protein
VYRLIDKRYPGIYHALGGSQELRNLFPHCKKAESLSTGNLLLTKMIYPRRPRQPILASTTWAENFCLSRSPNNWRIIGVDKALMKDHIIKEVTTADIVDIIRRIQKMTSLIITTNLLPKTLQKVLRPPTQFHQLFLT